MALAAEVATQAVPAMALVTGAITQVVLETVLAAETQVAVVTAMQATVLETATAGAVARTQVKAILQTKEIRQAVETPQVKETHRARATHPAKGIHQVRIQESPRPAIHRATGLRRLRQWGDCQRFWARFPGAFNLSWLQSTRP
jgi:hypothetical protein